MKKSARRERRKNAPLNPKSLADLEDIPEVYQRTFDNDNFLLYDSKAHAEIAHGRVLVFATRRNLEILGLKVQYTNDAAVREYFHMMAALAYVPVADVKFAYRALVRTMPNIPRGDEFNDYFNATYVNGVPGAGQRPRRPPMYEPQLWNVYVATLEGRAVTNNASEGWHNMFAVMVERKHPDL